jgi:hypothetical protein
VLARSEWELLARSWTERQSDRSPDGERRPVNALPRQPQPSDVILVEESTLWIVMLGGRTLGAFASEATAFEVAHARAESDAVALWRYDWGEYALIRDYRSGRPEAT